MKTTKKKLLSIYGKDNCTEFNRCIQIQVVDKWVIPEDKEFDIDPFYLERVDNECNLNQLNLLKSIGIIIIPSTIKWNREDKRTGLIRLVDSDKGVTPSILTYYAYNCSSFATKKRS